MRTLLELTYHRNCEDSSFLEAYPEAHLRSCKKTPEPRGPSFQDISTQNLRHTSKRIMRDAGVTRDVTDIIHGHAGSTVADTYGRGVALSRMKEALDKGFEGLGV